MLTATNASASATTATMAVFLTRAVMSGSTRAEGGPESVAATSWPWSGRRIASGGSMNGFLTGPRDASQQAVHGGHENERREGCEQESTDDGARERRVLLAALAYTDRHRDHAEDHRSCGHQHRAQTGEAGGLGRYPRHIAALHALIGEAHDQDAVGGGEADAHQGSHERRHAERRLGQEQHPHDSA